MTAPASPSASPTHVVEVAPSWRRALGGLVGWGLGFMLWAAGIAAFALLDPDPPEAQPWNLLDRIVDYLQARPSVLWVAFGGAVLAAIGVPLLCAWRGWRGPGMRLLQLELVDADGARPPLSRVLAWLGARFVGVALGGLSLYWSLVDRQRRTLHDRAAGLWLLHTRPAPRSAPRDPLRTSDAARASARSAPRVGTWGSPSDPR